MKNITPFWGINSIQGWIGLLMVIVGMMLITNLACLVALALGYWQPLVAEGVFCFIVGAFIFARI